MKLNWVKINGFRCFRDEGMLKLKKGKSLCLLAENGRGKSTVADALDFWCAGDVAWTRREGVGLSALVHLDRNEALIEVQVEGAGVARRKLQGGKAGGLEASGPLVLDFATEHLPLLRYKTMASFVDKTTNDKRAELLEALGLDSLGTFRSGVRSVARKLRDLAKEADQRLIDAERVWTEGLNGKAFTEVAKKLSAVAQLEDPIESEDGLAVWELPAKVEQRTNLSLAQAQELSRAQEELEQHSPALWSDAVADRQAAEERGLSTLLEAGKQVLANSEDDLCPLCLVKQDREALLARIEERAGQLATVDQHFQAAEAQLEEHEQAVQRLLRAIKVVLETREAVPQDCIGPLEKSRSEFDSYVDQLVDARRQRAPLPSKPSAPSEKIAAALQAAALTAPEGVSEALLDLAELKGSLLSLRRARKAATEAQGKHDAAAAGAKIADETVERAIQTALDRINGPLAEFYAQLVGKPTYSDLRLTYTQERAGGIDFEFRWDGRHDVRPPQRVMSESELNALGLALFLAHIKTDPPTWRTMVLDDVIAAFDAVHRTRFVRLLISEFADWQVILLTHDQQLSRTIGTEAPDWLQSKVTAWSTTQGPTFDSARTVERLRKRLDAGEPAEELGGLARQAIEEALERPVRKLGLKIRHDPTNTYAADEYRRALIDGLAEGKFPKANDPILAQLRTDGSTSNRACHFRDQEPGITEQDLRVLLEDIGKLEKLFHCDVCDKKVWAVPQAGSAHCQCECGQLSCA